MWKAEAFFEETNAFILSLRLAFARHLPPQREVIHTNGYLPLSEEVMHANGYLPLSGEVAAIKADGGVVLFCNSTLFVEEPNIWEKAAR